MTSQLVHSNLLLAFIETSNGSIKTNANLGCTLSNCHLLIKVFSDEDGIQNLKRC
jgi:hypothetical protein